MRRNHCVALLSALALGCIVEAPSGEKEKKKPAERRPAAPPIARRVGANFGGKVELAAVTVQPGVLVPGEATKVSIAFNVLEDMREDYTIFVHVEDVDGKVERMNLDHRPNNGKTPTNEWKKGQGLSDEFYLMLPPGVPLRGFNLYLGFWEPKSDTRLKIMNPDAVRNDGNDRLLLVQIPVQQ